MKYAALAVLTAGVLLLLAPFGAGRSSNGSAGARGFNGTDVMFLQMMLPHQGQAVKVARLARRHPVRPEVRTLAAAIETTQRGEARRIMERLRAWERPQRAPSDAHAAHGGVVPETTDAEIEALDRTPADRFERAFLNLLIAHQDDAVQLARMETGRGQDAWTRQLARTVDRSRSAQITRMLALVGQG
ncbi:DUF305 domain-containing protein [Actinomadura sp. 9N407]|uniref:DUF305 domain-containing protein n=1 Tax=Actinomadura sp. 9N407 TaxID=3375154 RepID=UPI003787F8BE